MSANKAPMLSKSRFLSGLQCYLCLWHSCYNRDLATDISPVQQAIFIYTTYEKGLMENLAEYFPQLRSDLLLIIDRFKDLCAIIKKHFYHPEFHGSFSLKSVLPAIVPDMDYGNLAVQEGNQASFEYLRMIDPSILLEEKERIK